MRFIIPVGGLGETEGERDPRSVLVLLPRWRRDIVRLCPPPPGSRLHLVRRGGHLDISPEPLLDPAEATCSNWPSRLESRANLPASPLGVTPRLVGKGERRSLEHLVCPQQQRRRNGQAECFGGLEVDEELELRGLLDK